MSMIPDSFFDRDTCTVAQQLLGKIIRKKYKNYWLAARIIETEAYYLEDKGSHASLGYTDKRRALFMPPGTIYMYYARGGDSLNISCRGKGNAVLIKSAFPLRDKQTHHQALTIMQQLNPLPSDRIRDIDKLCKGQSLLCRSMDIRVPQWDQKRFSSDSFFLDDTGYSPAQIIQTTRLGIPLGRDEHLNYRFIDYDYARYCTSNPLTRRQKPDYQILTS